jgi:hypothetical protein
MGINLGTDLDQSGTAFQKVRTYLGPSLGWVEKFVKPTLLVTTPGTTTLMTGVSVVLVNVAGLVTINLPDVRAWYAENACLPVTALERSIWIKDFGGHAQAFNISVVPFGTQTIDLLAQAFTLIQNRQLLRLWPINDMSGWFSG